MAFCDRLKSLDLFTSNINFSYRGRDKFSTSCGRTVTLIVITAYLVLIGLKMVEFVGETDTIEYMSITGQSMDEVIDLTEL